MTFNLLAEPWIPVLYRDGRWERVGICKALEDAGRIHQIAAANPMDRVAILRFLLALLYWCKGSPPDEANAIRDDSFPAHWFSKLDNNRDCFNLLGDGKRFYQYKRHGDKPLTANYLIHEIPTGTNKWHFRHSTDGTDGLCLACCAMGLVRLPLFTTSGGRGKSPGINAKPPLYVVPVGASLAETLRLSWRPAANLGTPAWKAPDTQLPKTGEVPLLVGLTWLPRRVWLDDPQKREANCISCGRRERLIQRSVFSGIGSAKNPERTWCDPHVTHFATKTGVVLPLCASDALRASDAAAGDWARLAGRLLESGKTQGSLWVVGFSTVQNDKYLEATECSLTLPGQPNQIQAAIDGLKRWQQETSNSARRTRPPHEKASSRQHHEISATLNAIRPHVEGRASAKATELLAGDQSAWEEAATEYRPMMKAVAKSLSPGFTTAAVQRRRQISCVTPDMRPDSVTAKRPKRSKGDAK